MNQVENYGKICWTGSKNFCSKDTKKCVKERKLKFGKYKNCLEATHRQSQKNYKKFIRKNKVILKAKQRFKSEKHNVFTEEINKMALSSNDDKRIQSFDLIETYA